MSMQDDAAEWLKCIDATLEELGWLPDEAAETTGCIRDALSAAGYVVAPREPSIEMLQNGRDAYRATQLGGLSGMTIEAQIRAQCRREAACWNAMISAAQEPQP